MITAATALERSGHELLRRLAYLTPAMLDRDSVCAGWSVRELVNHVIGGGHRYLLLLQGAAAKEVAATRAQDHVGDDPVASWERWATPLATAFAAPGALERAVAHPDGTRTGAELLRMRVLDETVHAWDVARSLGLDERLDHGLVEFLLHEGAPLVDSLRTAGRYAAAVAVPPAATAQERLLAFAGRRP